jgi:hypothetical protein
MAAQAFWLDVISIERERERERERAREREREREIKRTEREREIKRKEREREREREREKEREKERERERESQTALPKKEHKSDSPIRERAETAAKSVSLTKRIARALQVCRDADLFLQNIRLCQLYISCSSRLMGRLR